MEIFGGFMVMMSIIALFLAVVWLIMPFVVFAIKGKQDRMLEVLEAIEQRLAIIEAGIQSVVEERQQDDSPASPDVPPHESCHAHPTERTETLTGTAAEKNVPEASPAE